MRDQKTGSPDLHGPRPCRREGDRGHPEAYGIVLINNALTTNEFAGLRKFHLALVDALSVAEEAGLGSTINTAILGAYARTAEPVSMEHLEAAIRDTVPAKVEQNVAAAKRAYGLPGSYPESTRSESRWMSVE